MSELTNRPGRPVRRPDRRHTAGALDIRNIIGGLLSVYGVILLVMGLFGRHRDGQDRRRQRQPLGGDRPARRGPRAS